MSDRWELKPKGRAEAINAQQWIGVIRAMASAIETERDHLSSLDSTVGDGDHGTSLAKAMNAAAQQVKELENPLPAEVMHKAGQALQNTMGGASGIIFGAFFMGMANAFGDSEGVTVDDVVAGLSAGLAQVQKRGKAEPGGKTMVDALAPAVEVATAGAERGDSLVAVMQQAAKAAQMGAVATRDMVARYGRAKFLGERSRGHQDAGATSMAIMLAAWAEMLSVPDAVKS